MTDFRDTYTTMDATNQPANTPVVSRYINVYPLSPNTQTQVTWPTDYNFCNFSSDANFYMRADASAALPTASSVTNGTGSCLNPAQRQRSGDMVFMNIIAAVTANVTVEFWKGRNS